MRQNWNKWQLVIWKNNSHQQFLTRNTVNYNRLNELLTYGRGDKGKSSKSIIYDAPIEIIGHEWNDEFVFPIFTVHNKGGHCQTSEYIFYDRKDVLEVEYNKYLFDI